MRAVKIMRLIIFIIYVIFVGVVPKCVPPPPAHAWLALRGKAAKRLLCVSSLINLKCAATSKTYAGNGNNPDIQPELIIMILGSTLSR